MSTGEQKQAAAAAAEAAEVSLLDQVVEQTAVKGFKKRTTEELERNKSLLRTFLKELVTGHRAISKDAERTISMWIAEIDRLLSAQLNEILHHPEFQRLEASWRGLFYLVDKSNTGTMLKIKMLNVSKKDLLNDLERAVEFDQSALFKKVYEEEYGVFGGQPFGCLIGDYEFGKHPQDMALLQRVAAVAAQAHAPFISAASPELFGLDDFTELAGPRDLAKIFDPTANPEYIKWDAFRKSEDSRYVGLTLPHVLMRLPYGPNTVPVERFNFVEDVDGKDHHKYLWGNAAYALGARITDAFDRSGWLAAIRGVEGGGLVEGLPTHTFPTDDGDIAVKCPTEIAITDRRENELANLGFIPLCHKKHADVAAFFGTQSVRKPQLYSTDEANANERLSTGLQYMLCVSRFAHYLKVMARDKIGAFMERSDCERWLNQWILNYVLPNPESAGQEVRAQKPLREARIDVEEVPGRPGWYRAKAYLRPHYQFEGLTATFSLVANLPQSARG